MSDKLSEMIPKEQMMFFGLTVQRLNIDFNNDEDDSKNNTGNIFTLTLIKESGQIFELENINFANGVAPLANLKLGELNIIGSVVSWEETAVDIGGNSIFVVTLIQYKGLFLNSFKIQEASYVSKPEFVNNTILAPGNIINGTTFGSPISEIFALFENRVFVLGENNVFFNFDELKTELNTEHLIKFNKEETTLWDIIDDFAKKNDFNYSLDLKLVNNFVMISFIKNKNINELNPISREFNNILDALIDADNGRIINCKRGYTITKNFTQEYKISPSVYVDKAGQIMEERVAQAAKDLAEYYRALRCGELDSNATGGSSKGGHTKALIGGINLGNNPISVVGGGGLIGGNGGAIGG